MQHLAFRSVGDAVRESVKCTYPGAQTGRRGGAGPAGGLLGGKTPPAAVLHRASRRRSEFPWLPYRTSIDTVVVRAPATVSDTVIVCRPRFFSSRPVNVCTPWSAAVNV